MLIMLIVGRKRIYYKHTDGFIVIIKKTGLEVNADISTLPCVEIRMQEEVSI